ncbi:YfgM family protein [Enterobacteriaceae bacterium LUAb1]
MEMYSNEDEQLNVLRRFFSEYGKALATGAIIGIGILAGWRYWSSYQSQGSQETSRHYQQVTERIKPDNAGALAAAEKFVAENHNSYGVLASLNLAKQYVTKNQLDKAAEQLQQGLKDTTDVNLQAVLNLRLARIQIQQKKGDLALKTLDNVKGDAWAVIVADNRGEALLSKGDVQGARDAWSKGIAAGSSSALKEMMQMKINNLSS